MNEELFQSIFEQLQGILPDEWKKVIFYAGYSEGSYNMKFYVDIGDGNYKDCFELETISKMQLVKLFMSIDKIITEIRNNLEKEKRWTVLTMVVDADGNFKADYDYVNLNEVFVSYEQEWKKRYLI